MVRLTDRPDMTLDVYRGRKTTTQIQQQQYMNLGLNCFINIYCSCKCFKRGSHGRLIITNVLSSLNKERTYFTQLLIRTEVNIVPLVCARTSDAM